MKKLFFVFLFVLSAAAAFSQELSFSYPKDLAVPPSSEYVKTETTDLGTIYYFESSLTPKEFYQAFKTEMEKKKYTSNANADLLVSDAGGMVNWEKDTTKVVLLLGINDANKKTLISISYK